MSDRQDWNTITAMQEQRGARYDSTRQAWETIWAGASVEDELAAVNYPRSLETIRAYMPYLKPDGLILEAGSGLGAVIVKLRALGFPHVIGLDYAEGALHVCRRHFPDLPLTVGDVHALPFATESLDAYLSFGVLEHFEHGMIPALVEAYRVLKPGGTLVLTIPYPNVIHRLVVWRRRRAGLSTLTDDEFYESTYTRDRLANTVIDAGFTPLLIEPTSHAYT
ncbi:MAG: class I SAM-dependent methyltransferase, partial [Anaerolinea sp.]|nr:class I SAM-dependent methyltransferase [Anaerolinea sp.]